MVNLKTVFISHVVTGSRTPQTIEIKLQIVKNIIPFSSCDYDWKITFWNYVTSIDAKNRNTIIFKHLQIIKVDTRALTSQPRL